MEYLVGAMTWISSYTNCVCMPGYNLCYVNIKSQSNIEAITSCPCCSSSVTFVYIWLPATLYCKAYIALEILIFLKWWFMCTSILTFTEPLAQLLFWNVCPCVTPSGVTPRRRLKWIKVRKLIKITVTK